MYSLIVISQNQLFSKQISHKCMVNHIFINIVVHNNVYEKIVSKVRIKVKGDSQRKGVLTCVHSQGSTIIPAQILCLG